MVRSEVLGSEDEGAKLFGRCRGLGDVLWAGTKSETSFFAS